MGSTSVRSERVSSLNSLTSMTCAVPSLPTALIPRADNEVNEYPRYRDGEPRACGPRNREWRPTPPPATRITRPIVPPLSGARGSNLGPGKIIVPPLSGARGPSRGQGAAGVQPANARDQQRTGHRTRQVNSSPVIGGQGASGGPAGKLTVPPLSGVRGLSRGQGSFAGPEGLRWGQRAFAGARGPARGSKILWTA